MIVNPYDIEELGESIYRAAMMSKAEKRERMRSMRTVVRHNNVYRWAGQMLLDAASVRKRERVVEFSVPNRVGITGGARRLLEGQHTAQP